MIISSSGRCLGKVSCVAQSIVPSTAIVSRRVQRFDHWTMKKKTRESGLNMTRLCRHEESECSGGLQLKGMARRDTERPFQATNPEGALGIS